MVIGFCIRFRRHTVRTIIETSTTAAITPTTLPPISRLDVCEDGVVAGHCAEEVDEGLLGSDGELVLCDGVALIRGKTFEKMSARLESFQPPRGIVRLALPEGLPIH